jgi:UDP-2,4-diacetamido-2,4,6-trideoxy-beta-L-altropyranose hydrolase
MNIYIRVDASVEMGTGHVMRCLTLAKRLKENNNITFISRESEGNLCDFIEKNGFEVYRLQLPKLNKSLKKVNSQASSHKFLWKQDMEETKEILKSDTKKVDWLIVDNYEIDRTWEEKLRPYVEKIMVIDDLANREHDCDLLLDQNLYKNMNTRYDDLIPYNSKKLLGPKYVLLREEFNNERKKVKARNGKIKRILIFFGGSDPSNETMKAIKAAEVLVSRNLHIDVIVGSSNPNLNYIKEYCSNKEYLSFYHQVDNMAEMMNKADLAIGAGGSSTWERCYLGLPTIAISIAHNQIEVMENTGEKGIVLYLGHFTDVAELDIKNAILSVMENPELLVSMTRNCHNLFEKSRENNVVSYL